MSLQKELLVACSAENRIYNTYDDEYIDMPPLIYPENCHDMTDFEKYKNIIFKITGNNINYTTVDPAFTNIKKVDIYKQAKWKNNLPIYLYITPLHTRLET